MSFDVTCAAVSDITASCLHDPLPEMTDVLHRSTEAPSLAVSTSSDHKLEFFSATRAVVMTAFSQEPDKQLGQ